MSRISAEQGLVPTILDRLIDPDSIGTAARRGYDMRQIVAVVRRDLENLLNTRLGIKIGDEYPETANSIVNYGIPDFASVNCTSHAHREQIGRRIDEVIERFEPRLRNVRARVMEDPTSHKQLTIRFQIEAELRVEPFPAVAFETVLELTTGHTHVNEKIK